MPRHGALESRAGDSVSADGVYELHNVFGTPTGSRVQLVMGDTLPETPHGWTWRRVNQH